MGPSWYWMPDVFESFFNKFGKSVTDYYDLVRLDPSYQVVYENGDAMPIPAQMAELKSYSTLLSRALVFNWMNF